MNGAKPLCMARAITFRKHEDFIIRRTGYKDAIISLYRSLINNSFIFKDIMRLLKSKSASVSIPVTSKTRKGFRSSPLRREIYKKYKQVHPIK